MKNVENRWFEIFGQELKGFVKEKQIYKGIYGDGYYVRKMSNVWNEF